MLTVASAICGTLCSALTRSSPPWLWISEKFTCCPSSSAAPHYFLHPSFSSLLQDLHVQQKEVRPTPLTELGAAFSVQRFRLEGFSGGRSRLHNAHTQRHSLGVKEEEVSMRREGGRKGGRRECVVCAYGGGGGGDSLVHIYFSQLNSCFEATTGEAT